MFSSEKFIKKLEYDSQMYLLRTVSSIIGNYFEDQLEIDVKSKIDEK